VDGRTTFSCRAAPKRIETPLAVALRIQKREWKNADGTKGSAWRLIVEDYTGPRRVCIYPERAKYQFYGLDPSDTFERARERLRAIQAHSKIAREKERRARIDRRLAKEDLREGAYLPRDVWHGYLEWLKDRRMWSEIPAKTEFHLRCMRRLVIKVGACPSTWSDSPEKIFRWFMSQKLSVSYIDKVLPLLNLYGFYYCREFKKPFLPIAAPSRDVLRRIEDANLEERQGRQAPSKPLAKEHLAKLADIPEAQLRWMRLSFYFGLRPSEVDRLTLANRGTIWETRKLRGIWVLSFYQAKLVRIERERRWKRIPCILPEQAELLAELKAGEPIKRPYPYLIQSRLGAGYGTYAGRKGFEKFMRDNGQDFRNISRWLGHRDLNRTESNYRELEAVEFTPV
jgi:hypothetical protein